jgi:arsenite-transporting ATPase
LEAKEINKRIVIFGGKGGVGKTTAAAAYALAFAQANPTKKLLVFSTDPAHSLSDSFAEEIGELKQGVAGQKNLAAMEIDPGKWFEELKQRYRLWTDDLFASLAGRSGMEIQFDREAMRELVELTPPGIDEIAALGTISELLDQDRYDSIILDTAPTGHLIRFLELPEVALSWIRTFMKLLLKYQNVVRATEVAGELVALSKSIKKVLALLKDPELCEFVAVAIPETMSLEETVDLANALEDLQVPLRKLLINGVVSEEAAKQCRFCRTRRKAQLSVAHGFKAQLKEKPIQVFMAPQQPHEITGAAALSNHFGSFVPFGGSEKT